MNIISRCDECKTLFKRSSKDEEDVVEEAVADCTSLGDTERTMIRQLVRMRLCNRCARR